MSPKKKVKSPEQLTTIVTCAFCGGSGIDPFGLLSPLSICQVCSGQGKHTLFLPITVCSYCRGSGVHPHSRMTCTCCKGVGRLHIQADAVQCPACIGTGWSAAVLFPDSPLPCSFCSGIGLVNSRKAALFKAV